MAKYKIGITEAGDAGLDLSWSSKLDSVDGAVVITKSITPAFQEAALAHKDKIIIHATITGFGGTGVEPNVPAVGASFDALNVLIQRGFPRSKVVIRIDPIIPTPKGIHTAANVFRRAIDGGFSRFRISIIDMYPYVRERFKAVGLPRPYGDTRFSPSPEQVKAVDNMLMSVFCILRRKKPYP